MSMSRCTNFSFKNGKDEISVRWDLANGELEIKRERIPGDTEEKVRPQSICIRTSDLTPLEWIELSNSIYEAFGKLFLTYKEINENIAAKAESEFGCPFPDLQQLLEDDDEDDDEDED